MVLEIKQLEREPIPNPPTASSLGNQTGEARAVGEGVESTEGKTKSLITLILRG
jgi:hypothetical protein